MKKLINRMGLALLLISSLGLAGFTGRGAMKTGCPRQVPVQRPCLESSGSRRKSCPSGLRKSNPSPKRHGHGRGHHKNFCK